MEKRPLYGAEYHPDFLLQKAFDIQRILLDGQNIPESSVKGVFEYLTDRFLPHDVRKVTQKVNSFYNYQRNDEAARNELIKDSNEIAIYLSRIPFVRAIIPAGQFYCDGYDPLNRRFLGLMNYLCGVTDKTTYVRQDLPDYDLISVFDLDDRSVWPLKPTDHFDRQLFFKSQLESWNGWNSLADDLKGNFRSKKYPIGAIKLTGDPHERSQTVNDFMDNDAIALCFSHHIPTSFWNHLDLMICDDDYQMLSFIRDLIIGLDSPIIAQSGIRTDIGHEFQINYLLYQINKTGSQSIHDIMRIAFDTVAKTMPDRPRHSASSGLVNFSKKHWKKAFNTANESGLIEAIDETNYILTPAGSVRLIKILDARKNYLGQKYLTGT